MKVNDNLILFEYELNNVLYNLKKEPNIIKIKDNKWVRLEKISQILQSFIPIKRALKLMFF